MRTDLLLLIILCFTSFQLKAGKVRNFSTNSDPTLQVTVDSIDFRKDLTRVYCKFIGRPHTSHRVDASQIVSQGRSYNATDIDGVDFRRYFQWEDDGMINIEIDFPPMKESQYFHIIFQTVRGVSDTAVKKKK